MQRVFLQEKSLNRKLDNAEKSLNVDLSAKSKLIPYSTAADMLGLNDLYIEERDACENYRMIFTVNPVCTNVLYNAVTEPVYAEGSESAMSLVESSITRDDPIFPLGTINQSANTEAQKLVDQIAAVRDTEYSHEKIGNFKYHCGYDIFNNHLLRTNEFEHVKLANKDELGPDGQIRNIKEFNTLFDFAIDFSGKTVTRAMNESEGPMTGETIIRDEVRMYQLDNIKSINTAFHDELRSVDGWYGFYNTGYINIPNAELNGEEISLNKILNNEVPCGFIDLYPDRSLYSFIPKVNRYRKRLERNWDCGIVYPFESDYDMFARINRNLANAVCVADIKLVYNNVGDELIQMHSLLRHSLEPGDEVRLFYRDYASEMAFYDMSWDDYLATSGTEVQRYSVPVRVISIGNENGEDTEHYFTVKLYDIARFCGVKETEDGEKFIGLKNSTGEVTSLIYFFYRKIEDGCDDRYYFRKFKALKNYEYAEIKNCEKLKPGEEPCTEEEMEEFAEIKESSVKVIKEPAYINENSPEYIRFGDHYFKKITRPLTYTQNKIAFGENIYGDRVAQVIFNDDICITGLKDNLGRPLSTVYFTAIKTNRGHKEWYELGDLSAETVEYSHCFGEVTSGLDLPYESGSTEYNVRKLYNVFIEDPDLNQNYKQGLILALSAAPIGNYSGTPTPIESGITFDDFDVFYGDVVEFSRVKFQERTIEKVYHRFNSAQRECLKNDKYFSINYDDLVGDLLDVDEEEE